MAQTILLTIALGLIVAVAVLFVDSRVSAQDFPPVNDLPVVKELPDPLVMSDGTPVRMPDDWYKKRRPELKALFQHYIYGYLPPSPGITAQVTKEKPGLLDGRCTLKEVEIKFKGLPDNAPRIRLALFLPTAAKKPVPVFLGLNRCGNQTVIDSSEVSSHTAPQGQAHCEAPIDAAPASERDYWCIDLLIDRGYAFATFHESDIDPDHDDFTDGIHPYFSHLPGAPSTRWGTLAAWAWGLQRALDYLATDPQIDKNHLALIGHSRRGKTALLAAALDERVALVVPHQSGTGGMALSRNNTQESVEGINRKFPHWFNDEFLKFNGHEDKLPVDQHLLVALVAPRALLDTEGLRDPWANYDSALLNLQAADKVWKFLGSPGIVGSATVGPETKLNSASVGNLVQFRLDTEHTLTREYWTAILDFADKQFAAKP